MKNDSKSIGSISIFIALLFFVYSCGTHQKAAVQIKGKNIQIDFNQKLHSRVIAKIDNKAIDIGDFTASEFVTVSGSDVTDFLLKEQKVEKISNEIGTGQQYTIAGQDSSLNKEIVITFYDGFPTMAIFQVKYTNIGNSELSVDKWTNHHYSLTEKLYGADKPPFWSYQSGSYENRPDWVLPLKEGFNQQNYMGMNATDYGGGTPHSRQAISIILCYYAS